MKTMKITLAAMVGVLVLGLGSTANAQGFLNLSFGKHKRGKHFGFNIGIPIGGRPAYHPAPRPLPAPAPCHVHRACCYRVIPGHYNVVAERVWRPGCSQQIWEAPVYRTEYDHCGNPVQVLVRAGYYRTVATPGHWETIQRRVWIPARRELICGH